MSRDNQATAVIIANGQFPTHEKPLSLIARADYIVCCDGAADDYISKGGIPHAIVGDGDSISKENRRRFAAILHPDPDQETNDLTKSVDFCVKKGIRKITIVGGTGKREDHTIGNISLLAEYDKMVDSVTMVTDWGIFTPIHSTTEFKSFRGEQVSIFCIDQLPITTHNLKYPVDNRVLTNWWQGSLNESEGDSFRIETEGRVIVFQNFP